MDNSESLLAGMPAQNDPAKLTRTEPDYFITERGVTFAGRHLLIDLWEARGLEDIEKIDQALREAACVAGATLLHIHLRRFTSGGGISGVAVLAESHISIHTWPERGFVALDVFMCGDTAPDKTIDIFRDAFSPGRIEIRDLRRGQIE